MKFIDLQGNTNAQMPALGFGTWQLQGDDCLNAVIEAIKRGYRHIDTAQIYFNEFDVGDAIARAGVPRSDLFITTKLWRDHLTREGVGDLLSVSESLEGSLRMFHPNGTKPYFDMVLIHWPNPSVSLDETMAALRPYVENGTIRNIGVSNFPVAEMEKAVKAAEKHGLKIACNQIEYHALLNQDKVIQWARDHGIAITAYSPLAHGQLLDNPVLEEIARNHNKTPAQVALNWLVGQDGVAAIPKATHPDHIKESFEIFDFALSAEEREAINQLNAQSNVRTCDPTRDGFGFDSPKWDKPGKDASRAFNTNKVITVCLGIVAPLLLFDGFRRLFTKRKEEPGNPSGNKPGYDKQKIIGGIEVAGGFAAALLACKTGGLFRR